MQPGFARIVVIGADTGSMIAFLEGVAGLPLLQSTPLARRDRTKA